MKKIRTKQFGGKHRVILSDNEEGDFEQLFENLPEKDNRRVSDEQQEVVDLLREGFVTLSDMQKRVVMLMVDQNLTERKAAEVLGIAYPTLLNHLRRARKKLQMYVMQNREAGVVSREPLNDEGDNDEGEADSSTDNDTDETD